MADLIWALVILALMAAVIWSWIEDWHDTPERYFEKHPDEPAWVSWDGRTIANPKMVERAIRKYCKEYRGPRP